MMHVFGWILIIGLYAAAIIALGVHASLADDLPVSARRSRRKEREAMREARRRESIECATEYGYAMGVSDICNKLEKYDLVERRAA